MYVCMYGLYVLCTYLLYVCYARIYMLCMLGYVRIHVCYVSCVCVCLCINAELCTYVGCAMRLCTLCM